MNNKTQRIQELIHTEKVIKRGTYFLGEDEIPLKLSKEEIRGARVYLPQDIKKLDIPDNPGYCCSYSCRNIDAFVLAEKKKEKALVLNLGSQKNPGGGVRGGAKAQEEDLCRRSTLLYSLESDSASVFYEYNRLQKTMMGSDAVIISPNVEIFKDENGELLKESKVVSVITCAAPNLRNGMHGLLESEYVELIRSRICALLSVSIYEGYTNLILGALGCGAFRNDPKIVSEAFRNILRSMEGYFKTVDFAVLSNERNYKNYQEFSNRFQ